MKITIIDNKIKVDDIAEFVADGSDITEEKLLDLLNKITEKKEVIIDKNLEGDNFKKCELIKEILDAYITSYFDKSDDN